MSTDWIQVFQCLRVVKLFEVLSHFSKLKKLVHTLRLALPQVIQPFTRADATPAATAADLRLTFVRWHRL